MKREVNPITLVVGTQEFAEQYEALLRALRLHVSSIGSVAALRALIDAAILQAHLDGFDEGLSK